MTNKGKISKATKIIIWIVAIVIAIFIILFLTFLVSEQAEGIEQNKSLEPEQNQTEPELPEQNETEPEEPVSLEPFTYNNLSFIVVQKGDKVEFKTRIRIIERHGRNPLRTNVSFKTDPRQLDSIPSTLDEMPNQKTYVTFDNSAFSCNDSTMAAITLGYFLGLLGVDASSAVTDPEQARGDREDEVKTCEDASSTVSIIVLQGSEEAGVSQEEHCITVNIANCEAVASIDKLMLSLIEFGMTQSTIEAREF